MKRIGIIGLGLIGGSMAMDLRANRKDLQLLGVDTHPEHREIALARGLVDACFDSPDGLLEQHPELIILAVPVSSIIRLLPDLLSAIDAHTLLMDAGSTKSGICVAVEHHPCRGQFLAAHPIAGTEYSGPEAAFRGLFKDKPFILCDTAHTRPELLEKGKSLVEVLGAQIIELDAQQHDLHLAYVSHLSHVSSFMLAQTVLDIEKNQKAIFQLAGSGFASTVRLAKSSPEMWSPIFQQNAEFISEALQEYIIHLQHFQHALLKRDATKIHQLLHGANQIKALLPSNANHLNLKPQEDHVEQL